jgi:hypothetical protein
LKQFLKTQTFTYFKEMISSLNKMIENLPEDIVKVILMYLIPSISNIYFKKNSVGVIDNQYQNGYLKSEEKIMDEQMNLYLCRIAKKNGKHRYYITQRLIEIICGGCERLFCRSPYCIRSFRTEYFYKSKYVGKNLTMALLEIKSTNLFIFNEDIRTTFIKGGIYMQELQDAETTSKGLTL